MSGSDNQGSAEPAKPERRPQTPAERARHERELDEALKESFPASDPMPVSPGSEDEAPQD